MGSTLHNWHFCQVQNHVTQQLEQISKKSGKNKISTQCPSLRISGQLPAPIVNGRGDSFLKWKDFQLSRARDLDLGSDHTASVCRSSLSTYQISLKLKKLMWTNERTDGHLRPTSLGRLRRVDLKKLAVGEWPWRSVKVTRIAANW